MKSFGVTLLSGGLDSTTVSAHAMQQVENLTAITLHYGQTHDKEVICAKEVASSLGIQHELVDIYSFGKLAWYSSLTSPDRFSMPKDRSAEEMGTAIPITYVPLRNTFFVTIAAALLESQVLYAIEQEGVVLSDVRAYIFMAPNVIDYSGYPDCRPEFYKIMAEALMYGSKLWTQYQVPIQIETPIIDMSKSESVNMGIKLGAPLEKTWSCYEAGELPCGRCDSCILRAKGFAEAGHDDPLLVRLGVTRS